MNTANLRSGPSELVNHWKRVCRGSGVGDVERQPVDDPVALIAPVTVPGLECLMTRLPRIAVDLQKAELVPCNCMSRGLPDGLGSWFGLSVALTDSRISRAGLRKMYEKRMPGIADPQIQRVEF
jgi:hypothetical protein